MTLAALACISCWSCWGLILGAFIFGGWMGMVALALCIIGKDDHGSSRQD